MGKSLQDIAAQLKAADKKVQLIYAFNGTGKTRLSRAFKDLIVSKNADDAETKSRNKILYYNAFTEDLFYWDNDLTHDKEARLIIRPNSFTRWILEEEGQDQNIIQYFQHYTSAKLTPTFAPDFRHVTFSFTQGDDTPEENIKISKGEESHFIWSVFYSLFQQVISVLNTIEKSERETDKFNELEYIFIDDPVSSLDENHLIQLAVNLATLIKSSQSRIKFIVTTHNTLFYNVLVNELKKAKCYLLRRYDDGLFDLEEKTGDSNTCFSYHLSLKTMIEQAISRQCLEKYHFMLLRNVYEKTANFLGYASWTDLLPDDEHNAKQAYIRIIHFYSHSTLSAESIAEPTDYEKRTIAYLLKHLTEQHQFWQEKAHDSGD